MLGRLSARLLGVLRDPIGPGSDVPRLPLHLMRLFAVGLAAADAWTARHACNPDGMSYIDLSDSILRGDWEMALNAYWSPLYPLILGVFRAFTGFSPALELQTVHAANFAIYLVALLCFEYLLRGLLRPSPPSSQPEPPPRPSGQGGQGLAGEPATPSAATLVLVGYAFFAWVLVVESGLNMVTPDQLVAALVFLAAGMVVRMRRGRRGLKPGLLLGLVLGLGYLAKTPMLIVGAGFVAVAWLAAGGPRRGLRTALPAAGSFAAIAGAFILALSLNAGRFTYGDSGRLNYAWYVNRVRAFAYAGEDQGRFGRLENAPRLIHRSPPVYEFAEPIRATCPLWFAPAYWYEGVDPRADWDRQLQLLAASGSDWVELFEEEHLYIKLALICLLMALISAPEPRWRSALGLLRWYELWLPSLGALVMFSMIRPHVRYTAPFLVLIFVALIAGLRIARRRWGRLAAPAIAIALVFAYSAARDLAADDRRRPDDTHWVIAQELHEAGLRPGDRVGHVGNSLRAFWARLARLRIVADVPRINTRQFWTASPAVRESALDAFRRAGVRAVIATHPRPRPGAPWRRLSGDRYLLMLDEPAAPYPFTGEAPFLSQKGSSPGPLPPKTFQ